MKLHFSIAATEELRERRGGRYVLYSVCLEGFLLGMALHSQLRRWDSQLRQLFGCAVPGFPPKFYLVMSKSMADERQSQLEQYLQNVTLNSNITSSDVFIGFFKKLQLPPDLMGKVVREEQGSHGEGSHMGEQLGTMDILLKTNMVEIFTNTELNNLTQNVPAPLHFQTLQTYPVARLERQIQSMPHHVQPLKTNGMVLARSL